MDITFMVGNGFDIGLGMRTSFKDFFPIYCIKSLNKENEIKKLSENILGDADEWAYFEKQLGQYTVQFDEQTIKTFDAQRKDFISEFVEYLRLQENRLSFDDEKLITDTLVNALTKFYVALHTQSQDRIRKIFANTENDEHRFNFISFNYTSALRNCLAVLKDDVVNVRKYGSGTKTDKIARIVNVHGTKESFPIMGVNDTTQIANQVLANNGDFADRIVKPQINSRIRMNNEEEAINIMNKSRIICVYGMSLGETDGNWWDRLISWLQGDASRQLIIFIYDLKYSTVDPTDWMNKEDEIYLLLSRNDENKLMSVKKFSNRIHLAINENIFSMPLTAESDTILDDALAMLQASVV